MIEGKLRFKSRRWKHPALDDGTNCLFVGGFLYIYSPFHSDFYVYSLKTRQWRTFNFDTRQRYFHVVLVDDKLLLMGGKVTSTRYYSFIPCEYAEVYDLMLNANYGVCQESNCFGLPIFIEQRREVCIIRSRQSSKYRTIRMLNVDTYEVSPVRLKGEAEEDNWLSVVEHAGALFAHMNVGGLRSPKLALAVVRFYGGHKATVSRIVTQPSLKPRFGLRLRQVNGYLMAFGGVYPRTPTREVFIFNPMTSDVVETDKPTGELKQRGSWPPPHRYCSVSYNGKLLLIGKEKNANLIEIEFVPRS